MVLLTRIASLGRVNKKIGENYRNCASMPRRILAFGTTDNIGWNQLNTEIGTEQYFQSAPRRLALGKPHQNRHNRQKHKPDDQRQHGYGLFGAAPLHKQKQHRRDKDNKKSKPEGGLPHIAIHR